jgi:hypothetical protein
MCVQWSTPLSQAACKGRKPKPHACMDATHITPSCTHAGHASWLPGLKNKHSQPQHPPDGPALSMLSGARPADTQEAVPAGPSASASGPSVLVVVAGARGPALTQPIEAVCSWAMICSSFWFSRFSSSTCRRGVCRSWEGCVCQAEALHAPTQGTGTGVPLLLLLRGFAPFPCTGCLQCSAHL